MGDEEDEHEGDDRDDDDEGEGEEKVFYNKDWLGYHNNGSDARMLTIVICEQIFRSVVYQSVAMAATDNRPSHCKFTTPAACIMRACMPKRARRR